MSTQVTMFHPVKHLENVGKSTRKWTDGLVRSRKVSILTNNVHVILNQE